VRLVGFVPLLLLLPGVTGAVTLGQIDTFENGTTLGWSEGASSPNPPANISDGGPGGTGDNYLRNQSSGTVLAGSRMIQFNTAQWTGNYVAAGIDRIRISFKVEGSQALPMRLAFQGGPLSTRFATTEVRMIPADQTWHTVDFNLGSLTRISGSESVNDVLSDVQMLRILAATNAAWEGDIVAAALCVDDIEARHIEAPVLPTTWGGLKHRYSPHP
jgi:hypothetical protein